MFIYCPMLDIDKETVSRGKRRRSTKLRGDAVSRHKDIFSKAVSYKGRNKTLVRYFDRHFWALLLRKTYVLAQTILCFSYCTVLYAD